MKMMIRLTIHVIVLQLLPLPDLLDLVFHQTLVPYHVTVKDLHVKSALQLLLELNAIVTVRTRSGAYLWSIDAQGRKGIFHPYAELLFQLHTN